MTKPKVLLVGAGAMGSALLEGWDKAGKIFDTSVIDPSQPNFFGNISELSPKYSPDIILFAIKPQLIVETIPKYSVFAGRNCTFVSIAAGVGTSIFTQLLGKKETIVRVMPNLPVTVGHGMAGLYSSQPLSGSQKSLVESLFTASGKVMWLVSEDLMDAVTAISGSGPAYFFRLVECLVDSGLAAGLSAEQAMILARQTAIGAGAMLAQLPQSASELRTRVTSPGGTTAAAIAAFDKDDRLAVLVKEAVTAAINRARELGAAMGNN